MGKVVLFAGKEYPDGYNLATTAVKHKRSVVITSLNSPSENTDEHLPEGIKSIFWNKTSSLSARSLVLELENLYGQIDEAILIFDAAFFLPFFPMMNPEACSRASDNMITSYLFLSMEILNQFKKRRGGTLIFMLKTSGFKESSHKSNQRNPVNVLIAAGESAFAGLAESTALNYIENESIKILLVKGEAESDDKRFANWLFDSIDTPNSLFYKGDARTPQWIKLSSKVPKSFNFDKFFKR